MSAVKILALRRPEKVITYAPKSEHLRDSSSCVLVTNRLFGFQTAEKPRFLTVLKLILTKRLYWFIRGKDGSIAVLYN